MTAMPNELIAAATASAFTAEQLLRTPIEHVLNLLPGAADEPARLVQAHVRIRVSLWWSEHQPKKERDDVAYTSVDGDVLHLLLRTTIGAAMTMGVGGITQLECYVRTIAHAVEPPKKKRTKHEGPKMDFFQSGLKKMAERCVADLHTQPDLPGAPTVRDAVRVLGEASNILAGLVARDAPRDPPAS